MLGTQDLPTKMIVGQALLEEKIKIKCTRRASGLRERGSQIRNGFQFNCPQCNRLITVDTSSEDVNVRKAFQAAKVLRLAQEADARLDADTMSIGVQILQAE